jgi:hypothetical protein
MLPQARLGNDRVRLGNDRARLGNDRARLGARRPQRRLCAGGALTRARAAQRALAERRAALRRDRDNIRRDHDNFGHGGGEPASERARRGASERPRDAGGAPASPSRGGGGGSGGADGADGGGLPELLAAHKEHQAGVRALFPRAAYRPPLPRPAAAAAAAAAGGAGGVRRRAKTAAAATDGARAARPGRGELSDIMCGPRPLSSGSSAIAPHLMAPMARLCRWNPGPPRAHPCAAPAAADGGGGARVSSAGRRSRGLRTARGSREWLQWRPRRRARARFSWTRSIWPPVPSRSRRSAARLPAGPPRGCPRAPRARPRAAGCRRRRRRARRHRGGARGGRLAAGARGRQRLWLKQPADGASARERGCQGRRRAGGEGSTAGGAALETRAAPRPPAEATQTLQMAPIAQAALRRARHGGQSARSRAQTVQAARRARGAAARAAGARQRRGWRWRWR